MRIGKKRVRVPVLVTLGVCADGRRVVLDLLAGLESEQAWLDAVRSLAARNLGAPRLAVIDGNPGLAAALKRNGPRSRFSAALIISCGICWPRCRRICAKDSPRIIGG
jgi:transposase-like protein